MSYEAFTRDLAPAWLQKGHGKAWLEAHGAAKDAFITAVREAVLARLTTQAPSDALPLIGRERRLERYPAESDAQYRGRLQAAFDAWRWAGTTRGIVEGLKGLGLMATAVKVRTVDATRWAELEVYASGPQAATADPALVGRVVRKFKAARDKVAIIILLVADATGYFGFDGDGDAAGFGDATDPAVGGTFAEVV